jgi:Mg-chelatase subunit ChlD
MEWADQRRVLYLGGIALVLCILIGFAAYHFLYKPPSCFDGKQNGSEQGIDCGGSCARFCAFQVKPATVRFSRVLPVTPSRYSAIAYVDNPNLDAGVKSAPYTFSFYDAGNALLGTKQGTVLITPRTTTPVFVPDLSFSGVPVRALFELPSDLAWERATSTKDDFDVSDPVLRNTGTLPRIDATLTNTTFRDIRGVEAVVTVFDSKGNVVAASLTAIDRLPARTPTPIVFTWPQAFPKDIEACAFPEDIALLIDVSGSMDDDQKSPPEPLSTAESAAASFITRLSAADAVSVVSFATNANTVTPLMVNHDTTRKAVLGLTIAPKEETGFTNTGEGIKAGIAALGTPASGRKRAIVLLTDGLATAPGTASESEAYAASAASTAKAAGIALYTIGLGKGVNQTFLSALASPHSAYQAARASDLDAIYAQVGAALCEHGPAVVEIIPKSSQGVFTEGAP